MNSPNDVLAVSVPEAARRLGGSARTAFTLVRAKDLESKKIGKRRVVTVAALEKFPRKDHATQSTGAMPARGEVLAPREIASLARMPELLATLGFNVNTRRRRARHASSTAAEPCGAKKQSPALAAPGGRNVSLDPDHCIPGKP